MHFEDALEINPNEPLEDLVKGIVDSGTICLHDQPIAKYEGQAEPCRIILSLLDSKGKVIRTEEMYNWGALTNIMEKHVNDNRSDL